MGKAPYGEGLPFDKAPYGEGPLRGRPLTGKAPCGEPLAPYGGRRLAGITGKAPYGEGPLRGRPLTLRGRPLTGKEDAWF